MRTDIADFVLFNSITVTAVIQLFSFKASSERLKIISYLQKNAIVWHFCTGSKCSFLVNFKFSFKRSKGYESVMNLQGKLEWLTLTLAPRTAFIAYDKQWLALLWRYVTVPWWRPRTSLSWASGPCEGNCAFS